MSKALANGAMLTAVVVFIVTMCIVIPDCVEDAIRDGMGAAMDHPSMQDAVKRGVQTGMRQAVEEFKPKARVIVVYEDLPAYVKDKVDAKMGFQRKPGNLRGQLLRHIDKVGWIKVSEALNQHVVPLSRGALRQVEAIEGATNYGQLHRALSLGF